MKHVIIFLFLTTKLFGQTLSENEVKEYVKKVDSLKATNNLHAFFYPNMSACGGGLYGYYFLGELVFIDATYQGETGYSSKKIYFNDTSICKIIYREHFPEWDKYYKTYPMEKQDTDFRKMTYTDTLYTIILCNPIRFTKTSHENLVSKEVDMKLLSQLLICAGDMKMELESEKIKH